MNPLFKIGDRIKLVRNSTMSSHKVGDIGKIVDVKFRGTSNYRIDGYSYLIEVRGYSNKDSTWSWTKDLLILTPLNKHTIII